MGRLRKLPDLAEQSQPSVGILVFGRWHRFTHYDNADRRRSCDGFDSLLQDYER